VLSDLRASILGRKKKRRPLGELISLVEAWIERTGRDGSIRVQSDALGREIRRCRREMQRKRRERRRIGAESPKGGEAGSATTTLVDGDGDGDVPFVGGWDGRERDEHDFEGSIIDFYAKMRSDVDFSAQEASRDVTVAPGAGISRGPVCESQGPRCHTVYSESNYSSSSNQSSTLEPEGRTCSERAQAYRKLLGMEDGDGAKRESRARRREKSSEDRMTRWSDFEGKREF
jgi:hypothetical protein